MSKKILFIVNPISGVKSKERLPDLIENHLDKELYSYDIIETPGPKTATEITREALDKYDIIGAVGGDGSINEIASAMVNSDKPLAIIPKGSGNGLARHLGIPMNSMKAIKLLNNQKLSNIDYCELNDKKFFSIVGIGFDAKVAKEYEKARGRGFRTYAWNTIKHVFKYPSFDYELEADGEIMNGKAFQIDVSNSNQFGYNIKVAPDANLDDGKVVVCIVNEFPRWKSIFLFGRLLVGNHRRSRYIDYFKAKEVRVRTAFKVHLQVDGEVELKENSIDIKVVKNGLKVFIP